MKRSALTTAGSTVLAGLMTVAISACNAQSREDGPDQGTATTAQQHMGEEGHMGEEHMGSESSVYGSGQMMDHMRTMHGDFQRMSGEDHWMHDGRMMDGGRHMMSMSGHMAMMTKDLESAMGDLETMMGQSAMTDEEHLEQMRRHMQTMTEQLDTMRQLMSEIPAGAPGE